jgi:CheY-like chemotaxis protein
MSKVRKILLVDDDDDDRKLFSEAVHEINSSIEYITIEDSEKALHFLKFNFSPLPDIIFLDLNMPRKNGEQCLVEIKKTKKLSHIPIVIYSTAKTAKHERELKEKGAAYFMVKPARFRDICDELAEVIKKVEELSKVNT